MASAAPPVPQPAVSVPTRPRQRFPLVLVLALGVSLFVFTPLTMLSLHQEVVSVQEGPSVTVDIVADGLRFVPSVIHVPRGANVRINFANRDPSGTPHDLQTYGQRRDIHILAWPGENQPTVFKATDTLGRYAFICTIRGHSEAGMTGVIVVE